MCTRSCQGRQLPKQVFNSCLQPFLWLLLFTSVYSHPFGDSASCYPKPAKLELFARIYVNAHHKVPKASTRRNITEQAQNSCCIFVAMILKLLPGFPASPSLPVLSDEVIKVCFFFKKKKLCQTDFKADFYHHWIPNSPSIPGSLRSEASGDRSSLLLS